MKEIELKAHVSDRESLIKKLNEIAEFKGALSRDDTYWALPQTDAFVKTPSIRIRRETDENKNRSAVLTYKRKELKKSENGITTEVNEELESAIENPGVLETFFSDCMFTVRLTKHKDVMDWTMNLESGHRATLELCRVPPLGDFLEIEILTNTTDEAEQKFCQQELLAILELTGIDRSCIENRYYSELLKS